jgi:homoserine dehydrogenase
MGENDKVQEQHADYHHKQLVIGLFGFGVVGEGLYRVLHQTPSLKATIKKVCIRHPDKHRNAPPELFTTHRDELLDDEEINVIVEVIDDANAAFEIVKKALLNGKHVVSASKKMIAEHLPELLKLQQQTGRSFLYEASACASIPVIRNLEEYYDNDLLHGIQAIVNGSTNFILTKMFEEKLDYRDALLLAQQLGFAESDPTLDVEGYDAVNKWNNLLAHAYGIVTHPSKLLFTGIQNIQGFDANVAAEKGWVIRLVAQAKKLGNGKVAAFVLPQFVKPDDHLSFVRHEYNGVVIESGFADKQFFYGKGAGSFPTASAVLSDISALRYDYRYEYKKLYHHTPGELTNDYYLRAYFSFSNVSNVSKDKFEWIEEWHAREDRKYLAGVIHVFHLLDGNWWHENGNSLILMPDPIIESLELHKLKKKSLELAGLQLHHGFKVGMQ